MRRSYSAMLLASASALGCLHSLDAFDPQVGDPVVERCVNQDSDFNKSVSFAGDVLPLLKGEAGPVGCGCHQPSNPNPIGFLETGLDLSSFAGLSAGGTNSRATIVVPGSPCESVLWQKVTAGPPFGARMPFDGPPFLEEAERRLIADWIAEGARDN